jgi:hypothetical protein
MLAGALRCIPEQLEVGLDVPGVYLLIGPPEGLDSGNSKPEAKLYVGQADSVADGLDSRLKSEKKKRWRTAVVFRRADKNPLNLSQCKFLESRLCRMQSLSLGLPQGVFRPSRAGAEPPPILEQWFGHDCSCTTAKSELSAR